MTLFMFFLDHVEFDYCRGFIMARSKVRYRDVSELFLLFRGLFLLLIALYRVAFCRVVLVLKIVKCP